MANSTTNLDTISSSQASKEVTANALFDASSVSTLFGRRASTTSALTWGYYGGVVTVSGTPTAVANGTLALSASLVNYVEYNRTTGALAVNTSGWTAGYDRVYAVTCGASSITSYVDWRFQGIGAPIAAYPMVYISTWNAATNTPTLAGGTGTKGYFYKVSTGGTQDLGNGSTLFTANDSVVYNGSTWDIVQGGITSAEIVSALGYTPIANGGALGTPSSGTVTNLTGTASININGTVGAATPATGAFTTLSATNNHAWSGFARVLEMSNGQALSSYGSGNLCYLTGNAYYDVGDWKRLNAAGASRISQAGETVGVDVASSSTAGSVISWTSVATFASTGLAVTGDISSTTSFNAPADSGLVWGGADYIWGNATSHFIKIRANGVDVANITSTGLAVTGTIKSSTTIGVGNATPAASGAGITFPATQSASSDANTLDDYEEGTWTPNQGAGLTLVGAFSSSGSYTKIGRQVTITGWVAGATSVELGIGGTISTNLPFATSGDYIGSVVNGAGQVSSSVWAQTNTIYGVEALAATPKIYFTVTYFV